tara:strand:+ start:1035 stop:1181 length:147 start_codon:yes stop_codon:yes gene_type:complete
MIAEVGRFDLLLYAIIAVCGVILSVSLKYRYYRNKKVKKTTSTKAPKE